MCECFVCLGHFVNFVTLANGVPLPLISLHYLGSEGLFHRDTLSAVCEINQPAERKCELPVSRDFKRHLIGCTTDAASFDLKSWLCVVHSTLEHIQWVGSLVLGGNLVESAVNDT